MMRVRYPRTEAEVVRQTTSSHPKTVDKVLSPAQILKYQELVLRVPVADSLIQEAVAVVRKTRPTDDSTTATVKEYVSFGAGPRAAQHLILCAKARAILNGRPAVDSTDLRALATSRAPNHDENRSANRISADDLIEGLLAA